MLNLSCQWFLEYFEQLITTLGQGYTCSDIRNECCEVDDGGLHS